MTTAILLALACLVASAAAQLGRTECPPTEVLFLLDESENAQRAASVPTGAENFRLLRDALIQFMQNPLVAEAGNRGEFRVGAISYSGNASQIQSLPRGTSPQQAVNYINNPLGIGSISHAGSWTFMGLEAIGNIRPSYQNQRVILISSQGSSDPTRRQRAVNAANQARSLGWTIDVIAVQGVNPIDYGELTQVKNNPNVAVVTTNYQSLPNALNTIITQELCTRQVITEPPPTQAPPSSGICADCLFNGGYGFDFDPLYCDSYYQCFLDKEPMRRSCGVGTFWDGSVCNHIRDVNCPQAPCNQFTANGTMYPSGRCCNKYFVCMGGRLRERPCPTNQVFSASARRCVDDNNLINGNFTCGDDRHVCDIPVTRTGLLGQAQCGGYSADSTGNPCRFNFGGFSIQTPRGTIWDQSQCSFVRSPGACQELNSYDYFGAEPASQCSATFLANYTNGNRNVYSERMGRDVNAVLSTQEVRLEQNAVIFDQTMQQPYAYYYFFNNRDFQPDIAFRVRFRLDNPENNLVYDILSNNYCPECPHTISFTVRPLGNQRQVSASFNLLDGNTATVQGTINKQNAQSYLELIVIMTQTEVYGEINEVGQFSSTQQTVNLSRASKQNGANVNPNRCGIVLGRGPNSNFVGAFDVFAVYENCQDINQVTQNF